MPESINIADQTLSYSTAERTAIRSWHDGGGVARIAAIAIIAAAVAAAPSVLVTVFKLPAGFLLAVTIAQGSIAGLLLKRYFVRFDLRSRSIATWAAILSGCLTVVFCQAFVYLRDAHEVAAALDRHGALATTLDMIGFGHSNPYSYLSRVATIRTGHGGIVGWFGLRVQAAPHLPTILFLQSLLNCFIAKRTSKSVLAYPTCPACGAWLRNPRNLAVVPTSMGRRLADAIRSDDLNQVGSIVHAGSQASLGRSCAVARQQRCAACRSEWVDAVIRLGKMVRVLLAPMAVSEKMVVALRAEAAIPVVEEPPAAQAAGS